ncbi:hypothetical protein Pla123a_06580 [Posidoniimonas polymericola]|uniref:PEP-CTERM protein-sorting domain-containing protein n=2 Tax=Posidoniimonas polymericola TaxID=2528002 RepID=A0A5C5ZG53_9BACT|nr:hypothetical protein Pla123a_06580 [Posidoniimonas polymericola]
MALQRRQAWCVLAALALAGPASAVNIFLSSSGSDPYATDGLTLAPRESAELFVWIQPDAGARINGAAFDIASDNSLLSATAFDVLNPEVLGQPRWQGSKGPSPGKTNRNWNLVDGSVAVAVTSSGLDAALVGSGWDPYEVDGAFLHGTLTIEAGDLGGTTRVFAAPSKRNPLTVRGLGVTPFDAPAFVVEVTGPTDPRVGLPTTSPASPADLALDSSQSTAPVDEPVLDAPTSTVSPPEDARVVDPTLDLLVDNLVTIAPPNRVIDLPPGTIQAVTDAIAIDSVFYVSTQLAYDGEPRLDADFQSLVRTTFSSYSVGNLAGHVSPSGRIPEPSAVGLGILAIAASRRLLVRTNRW